MTQEQVTKTDMQNGEIRSGNDADANCRIAIPVTEGRVSMHFGHCEEFAIFDVKKQRDEIISKQFFDAPPHEPGFLPKWLSEKGVNLIITGGIGGRAQQLFAAHGIEVVSGASPDEPGNTVQNYLNDTLQTGLNACDH